MENEFGQASDDHWPFRQENYTISAGSQPKQKESKRVDDWNNDSFLPERLSAVRPAEDVSKANLANRVRNGLLLFERLWKLRFVFGRVQEVACIW